MDDDNWMVLDGEDLGDQTVAPLTIGDLSTDLSSISWCQSPCRQWRDLSAHICVLQFNLITLYLYIYLSICLSFFTAITCIHEHGEIRTGSKIFNLVAPLCQIS